MVIVIKNFIKEHVIEYLQVSQPVSQNSFERKQVPWRQVVVCIGHHPKRKQRVIMVSDSLLGISMRYLH